MPDIILTTKLNQPAPSRILVPRKNLLSRLEQGLSKKTTLVSAPAGFGKTMLAVQWLEQTSRPCAWLSLEKNDSDVGRFLLYFVAAIQQCVPEFGNKILSLLSAVSIPPSEYLADCLIVELGTLDDNVLIVFDDYHSISSVEVQKVIIKLLEHLPDTLHLVFLTRSDPPWPLAKWRATGFLNEFRAADLCFSREEVGILFKKHNFPEETVTKLYEQSEGWITGLQLMKLSLDHSGDPKKLIRNSTDDYRLIQDYLMEEIVTHLSSDILDFLAVTSLFDRFCEPLCDSVLTDMPGKLSSREYITRFLRENLFLVPLDREHKWFRYHHLFHNLVKQHLNKHFSQEKKEQFFYRAGKWFAGQRLLEEALTYFIASGDLDAAALLVAENMHAAMTSDLSRRTLIHWLDMFPSGAANNQPVLLVADCMCKTYNWDFPGIKDLLNAAEALLSQPASALPDSLKQSLLADIDAQRGFYLYWLGDAASALHHAERALNVVSREHVWSYTTAIIYTAASMAALGRRSEALQLLSDKLAEDCSEGSRDVGQIQAAIMGIQFYAGNLAGVERAARQVLEIHDTVPVADYWLIHAYYFLGCAAYERNLLDVAADSFGKVEQMIYRTNTRIYHDCLLGLALVAQARGEAEKARGYAQRALSFTIEMNDPYSKQLSDSFATRLDLLLGKLPAQHETWVPGVDCSKFWLENPSLTHAEYLLYLEKISSGDSAVLLQNIEEGKELAAQYHNTRQVIQFLTLKALALKCSGRIDEAVEVIEETLSLAESGGFVRTFVDHGPLMKELLHDLVQKKPDNFYALDLLNAFQDTAGHGSLDGKTVGKNEDISAGQEENLFSPELSDRELDVLTLLEKRYSNKEIAQQLYVSPHTIKKHTINIYRKLYVNSRRQAIKTARQLGLIT